MPTRVLLVTVLSLAFLPGRTAAAPVPAPCASCLGVALDPADAERLVSVGRRLDGVDLVFEHGVPSDTVRDALSGLGARLWVSMDATPDLSVPEGVSGVWLVPPREGSEAEVLFALQRSATTLRAASAGLTVGLMLDPRVSRESVARGVAPYVSAVRVPARGVDGGAAVRAFGGLAVWRDVESSDPLGVAVPAGERAILRAADAVDAARQVAVLGPLLPPGLTPLSAVRVSCDACRASVFLHPDTLHAIAIVEADGAIGAVRLAPSATRVTMIDPDAPAGPVAVPGEDGRFRLESRRAVLDVAGWRGGEDEVFRDVVQVTAERALTVEEILARHQAWRARQDGLVRTTIASGTTVITFDVPGFAGPATVTASTRTFTRGALVEMEQRDIRMNGVALEIDGTAPRLPIIEPERVMTPPLVITLGAAYAYRLDGRERAGGRECYVVSFGPRPTAGPSFQGRAWIDTASFALVRLAAVQTGLRGAVVSARQRDEFAPVPVGDREAWLPARSTSDQIYQAAGFRTPIHREVAITAHEVNAPDFEARRDAALRSRVVILRDTPRGYEYLVPAPGCATPGARCATDAVRVPAARAGRRVVTAAFGVIDDPNISVPLPYAGLSYLDFDLFGRGIQLSGFFGGAYGQAAWTIPGVIRPGWQLTGRAFAIAASYNDRSFRDGIERYEENVRQRPAHVDAALVIPLASRVQLRAGYELDVTAFDSNEQTAPDFRVPPDAVVHGVRIGLDVQHGSWSTLAWWNPAWRQGWRAWGRPGGEGDRSSAAFERYGVTVARAWAFSPGAVARVEGSWVGGRDLDRFSRYTVDGFDNRLRGYPSASLRYDRGALVRTAATWTPVGRVRLDGFADCAAVHDPGFGRGLRGYPGLGAAAEIPMPARLLLTVEWGYGFNARNTDGSKGTQVVRVAGLKVF